MRLGEDGCPMGMLAEMISLVDIAKENGIELPDQTEETLQALILKHMEETKTETYDSGEPVRFEGGFKRV